LDFSKLFPENANNNYVGHKFALWGFILFTCVMTWRSIVHMFFEKYGFHEIANFGLISGDPDPMPLIYRFFSLWGFAQLIFCTVCWVVIFRYRALIPLIYLLWLFEWGFRTFGYPLLKEEIAVQGLYTNGMTPGTVGAPFITILLLILFSLSLLKRN
jgi:hypothetical protein